MNHEERYIRCITHYYHHYTVLITLFIYHVINSIRPVLYHLAIVVTVKLQLIYIFLIIYF